MQENRVGFLGTLFSARRTNCHYSQAYPQSTTQPTIVSHHKFQSWSLVEICCPTNDNHTPAIQLLRISHPHFLQRNCTAASCSGQFYTSTRFNFLDVVVTYITQKEPLTTLKYQHCDEFHTLCPKVTQQI